MKNNEHGRSMIEMLGVLGIIGIISVSGLSGFGSIMTKQRAQDAFEQIMIISSKISIANSNSSSYSGLNNCSAIKFNALPENAILSKDPNNQNCTLISPFKTDILISDSDLSEINDKQAFTITYKGLNRNECVTLAAHDFGSSNQSSLVGISLSSKSEGSNVNTPLYLGCQGSTTDGYVTACPNGSTNSIPLSPSAIAKGCNCNDNKCTFTAKYF